MQSPVAAVTGGASGMGEAIAHRLTADGFSVAILDRDVAAAAVVARDIGCDTVARELDVRDLDQWRDVLEDLGPLQVLVNSAGIASRRDQILRADIDDFRDLIEVNLFGTYYGMVAVAPLMPAGGSIVNISSISGILPTNLSTGYAASKWAVRGLSKAGALELAERGIRVNSIHPGVIDTPMSRHAGRGGTGGTPPLGRIGDPAEVAGLVSYLVSADGAFCTGSEFVIDGGATAGRVVQTASLNSGRDREGGSGAPL